MESYDDGNPSLSASSDVTSSTAESLFAVDLSFAANLVREGLDDVDSLPDSLSGGKARSQSIGIANGIGLVDAIPSVATRIESRRILFVDKSVF